MTTVTRLSLRDFRCYSDAQATLGSGLTVVWGPNGAGKTNLLEGLYFGCTGRSCRTTNEREVLRIGASSARVVVDLHSGGAGHELSVGFAPGQAKRMQVDRAPVERLIDNDLRPLVSVFLPDRLELIKGAPSLRRAHLDQFVAALWPSRSGTRKAYGQALAQRNSLLMRIRAGVASRASVTSWDQQLARAGVSLMADRREAVELLTGPFTRLAVVLGLDGTTVLRYRPRSPATDSDQLASELAESLAGDIERGFTGYGPHRDELIVLHDGHDLRAYGSQGQQRLSLLALLLAEREALASLSDRPPLMLLDDVMSELDRRHREALVEVLRDRGQAVITTTDLEHVPGADGGDVKRVEVSAGAVVDEPDRAMFVGTGNPAPS